MQCKGASLVAVVSVPRQLVDYSRLGEVARLQRHGYGARLLPPGSGEDGDVEVLRAADAEETGALGQEEVEEIRDANRHGVRRQQRRGVVRERRDGEEEGGEGAELARREDALSAPWLRIPEWMPTHLESPQEREARMGEQRTEGGATVLRDAHVVAFAGPLAYCVKCANFAHRRVGAGMTGICAAPSNKRANAVASRLARLRVGRHPLSGKLL